MKSIYLILIISLFNFSIVYTQSTIDNEISSLKNEKKNIQTKIKTLQSELHSINSKIKVLEEKKAKENSSNGTISATVNSLEGILRDKPSSLGNEIAHIKAGEKISVHHKNEGLYLKVTYLGKTGYLNYSSISSDPAIDKILTSNTQQSQTTSTTTIISVDTNSPKYKRLSKLYGSDKAMKIMSGQLWKGMSHGQVIESLGQPSNKKTINTLEGQQETWQFTNKEAIFLNGELDSWKDR